MRDTTDRRRSTTRRARRAPVLGAATAGALAVLAAACAPPATTQRLSTAPGGVEADGPAFDPAISADGRFVAFGSEATNMTPSGSSTEDVFLLDRATGRTRLVSGSPSGGEANGSSFRPSLSGDGSKVAFTTVATDVVTVPDGNGIVSDIVVRDRSTGTVRFVSVSSSGAQADGRSRDADVSSDGRFVAFSSHATNLVPSDTNQAEDVFLHELGTGTTIRVSVGSIGAPTPAGVDSTRPAVSGTGRAIAFLTAARLAPGDTDGDTDVYVRDRQTLTTRLASFSGASTTASAVDLSADGRYVAFVSTDGGTRRQAYARDLVTGQLRLLSHRPGLPTVGGNADAVEVAITDDGGHVTFTSGASDLVGGDTNGVGDAFLVTREGGNATRVSVTGSGGQADDFSTTPVAADGARLIAFRSAATDLVTGDGNGETDVFLRALG